MNGKVKKLSRIGATTFFLGMLVTIFAGCASNTMAVKETKKDAAQSVESKLITDISFTEDSESAVIWVRGNRLLTYT